VYTQHLLMDEEERKRMKEKQRRIVGKRNEKE
jgi:hypothetical protein